MAIAFDKRTSLGSPGTGTLTATVTPVGTPRSVLVMIVANLATTDEITSVTYGGVALTQCTGSPLLGIAGSEDGVVSMWHLGSGIPIGAQTCTVNVDGTGSTKDAKCYTATAGANTEQVVTCTTLDSAGTTTPDCPAMTISASYGECHLVAAILSGADSAAQLSPATGWTQDGEIDFGVALAGYAYKTTNFPAGGGDTGVLAHHTTSVSVAAHAIAIALSEVAAVFSGGKRYFTSRYFPDRYFPIGAAVSIEPPFDTLTSIGSIRRTGFGLMQGLGPK